MIYVLNAKAWEISYHIRKRKRRIPSSRFAIISTKSSSPKYTSFRQLKSSNNKIQILDVTYRLVTTRAALSTAILYDPIHTTDNGDLKSVSRFGSEAMPTLHWM